MQEFATLKDVKLFRVGTHHSLQGPYSFEEGDLDEMIEASNACQDVIVEAQESGVYRGNETLDLQGKPIPAVLNLGHQRWLADSMKSLLKGVKARYYKLGDWVAASFENVPNDVAEYFKERAPYRSVELFNRFVHPDTGRAYKNVIRSTAFLPPDMPPAVSGQAGDWAVEYSGQNESAPGGVITVYCQPTTQEVQPMDEKQKDTVQTPPEAATQAPVAMPNDGMAEYAKELEDLKKQQAAALAEMAALKEENKKLSTGLATEYASRQKAEISSFCDGLHAKQVHGKRVAPALFGDEFKAGLLALDNVKPIEFAEGSVKTARHFVQDTIASLIEAAADGSLLVEMQEQAAEASGKPEQSLQARRDAMIQEYQQKGMEYVEAYKAAVDANPALWND